MVDIIRNWLLNLIPLIPVFLICLPVHEFAHAFAADRLGDPTPRRDGRLSLNPLHHLDPLGSLCMILTQRFGWAKPVVVNPFMLRDGRKGMAIVAVAGPIANLIMTVAFAVLARLVWFLAPVVSGTAFTVVYIVVNILLDIAIINLGLAVFNLIPIPPLDGSKILYFFIPQRIAMKIEQYEFYIQIAFMVLLFSGVASGFVSRITTPIWNFLWTILHF